ncbi:hypothetical protein DAEQUDRAFT_741486 [Daedalea quercina L-15889]|uniref:Uncharacterized protein n=1 Tax=Daedalea quercina L-15889 TaxID=1314783 RepID=A0A165LA76_9APHY|nr:hypothetical protein DAEQUDRAFT_741486 [Daedalea quercina L-15889]
MAGNSLAIQLASLCLVSVLYGIFTVLCLSSSYFLLASRSRQSPHERQHVLRSPIFVGNLVLFASITAHWSLTVARVLQAMFYFRHGTEADLYLNDMSQPTNIAQSAVFVFCLSVYDALMIHRVWVLWRHSKAVVIFPVCTWLAYTARVSIVQVATANIASIIWRVWIASRKLRAFWNDPTTHIISIFIESALLWIAWVAFFLAAYEAQSCLQNIGNLAGPVIAGISLMLINARVGLGSAFDSELYTPDGAPTTLSIMFTTREAFDVEHGPHKENT